MTIAKSVSRSVRSGTSTVSTARLPASRHDECEPVDSYQSGRSGWYGPVHSRQDNDGYNPDSRYPSESADSSNVGKKLPGSASYHGFGENGKALTQSGGS